MILRSQIANDIQRIAFWLKSSAGGQVFAWLHAPSGAQINQVGALVVGPVGPEYMHSHRTMRFLADELARQGFATLRYDPAGMGNSAGDLSDEDIVAQWGTMLKSTKDFFQQALGIPELAIVSLRSGALIANEMLAAQQVAGAVFWYPYLKGAAFVRDMQIIDSMLHLSAANTDFIEAGGYPFHAPAQRFFSAVDLLLSADRYLGIGRALVINNAAQPPTRKLQQLFSAAGIDVIQRDLGGLERMMKQAEITRVPEDNIAVICDWFSRSFTEKQTNSLARDALNQTSINQNLINQIYSADRYRETALAVDASRPMFAVLTEPVVSAPGNHKKPLLVFVNGGSGHHVGPNRLYVDICRTLAAEGFSTVRLDLSNLGDSAGDISPESHNPYAPTAAEDIQAALRYLREARDYDEFILSGLCSGAHNAFQAVLQLQSAMIREVILINPLAFYWKEGDSMLAPEESQHEADATHYQDNIRSLHKWISLFTDIKKLRRAFGFIVNIASRKIQHLRKLIAGRFGVAQLTRLEQDILKINIAGTRITLFIGAAEPGYRVLLAHAGDTVKRQIARGEMQIAIIDNGDHTFSTYASRQDLVRLCVKHMTRY